MLFPLPNKSDRPQRRARMIMKAAHGVAAATVRLLGGDYRVAMSCALRFAHEAVKAGEYSIYVTVANGWGALGHAVQAEEARERAEREAREAADREQRRAIYAKLRAEDAAAAEADSRARRGRYANRSKRMVAAGTVAVGDRLNGRRVAGLGRVWHAREYQVERAGLCPSLVGERVQYAWMER